ncbi:MAG: zinc metallopeptidase [Firmicutes bacterium]|nr:zinc metallopeptidase [Bacillota bacterium]
MNAILYILIILIPVIAQINISSSYGKYKKVKNSTGLSGFEVARKILDANGLEDIYVVETNGNLTDHYDPNRKVIKLSKDIFKGETIAAASVAAHECGHAIQDKESYTFMRIRSFLVPVVNLVSSFSWAVIFIGLISEAFNIFIFGIGLISIGLIFQLVTLPVEFDASKRAKKELEKLNLIGKGEDVGVSKMLGAAAMTYVASVLTSVLQIIRLIAVFNDRR